MFCLIFGIIWFSHSIPPASNVLRVNVKNENFVIMGYFPNWARWRPPPYSYAIEKIDGSLITHLVYAFLQTDIAGEITNETPQDYEALQAFQRKYPLVKIMMSIGGYGNNSLSFGPIATNVAALQNFASNVRIILERYGFDGLDLDWEYPGINDKSNYISMLKALYGELKIKARRPLLLTAAVPVSKNNIDDGYDVLQMNRYLDLINVMAYDYHGLWNDALGHNSPLIGSDDYNVDFSIKYWIQKGIDYHKIILGLGFYGRTFVMKDPLQFYPGSLANKFVSPPAGKYTRSAGFLAYYEIKENNWATMWDPVGRVPYAYKGYDWVSYENIKSLNIKIKYACLKRLRGFMIWDLSMDDMEGTLLRYVRNRSKQGCGVVLLTP